jgi:serine/threonine-protein kinase
MEVGLSGEVIHDRYEVGSVIGSGGMAVVHDGWDRRLERNVAVKLMRPDVAHQPAVRERFEAEARTAARLVHPNVVSVFDSGEWDGLPFIVMERLPGESLYDRMRRGPLPPEEVGRMALEVLAALDAAHGSGVLHRDIKPANILATPSGHWKVADFGIAKALEAESDATLAGLVVGTPAYLPPERRMGAPASVESDLYALGVVMYEALAGRRPFEGADDTVPAALVPSGPPPALPWGQRGDPPLEPAIRAALATDPSSRFHSAGEMAEGIRSGHGAIGGGTTGTEPAGGEPTALIGAAGPATEVLPVTRSAPGGRPPARRTAAAGGAAAAPAPPRHRPGWMAAATVVLVLLAGGLTYLAVARGGSTTPSPSSSVPATATTTATSTTGATTAPTSTSATTTPPTTAPVTTVAPTTTPPTTAPPTTTAPTTAPVTTVAPTTTPPTSAPSATVAAG